MVLLEVLSHAAALESHCFHRACARVCFAEKSNVFLKDPTDLMTNVYGDTLVTTNGKKTQQKRQQKVVP